MLTELRNPVSHEPLSSTSESLQILDQLTSEQMARMEEALAMANVLLKLAAMDASLTAYISAAETTPDLVQRLVIARQAASKESQFKMEQQRSSVDLISVDEISRRLEHAGKEESRAVKERRKEKMSKESKTRSSSRSVC